MKAISSLRNYLVPFVPSYNQSNKLEVRFVRTQIVLFTCTDSITVITIVSLIMIARLS